MLQHYQFFTIEAWVRPDTEDEWDSAMNAVPGQVIHKIDLATGNPIWGFDMSNNAFRCYHMGKFKQYAWAGVGDNDWHYLAATFQRFDIDTLTQMWA